MKEKIDVVLQIKLFDSKGGDNRIFSDDWNFQIDKYTFKKISDEVVEIAFSFEAVLVSVEDGVTCHTSPSEGMREFTDEKENLNRLLDIISLTTQVGVKIIPKSYKFKYLTGSSERPTNKIILRLEDTEGLEKRFKNIKDKKIDEPIIKGLRLYRSFLNDTELGWKITKLWSVFEQLYGKCEGTLLGLVPKKEKQDFLKKLNALSNLNGRQLNFIQNRIMDLRQVGVIEAISQNMKIMNENGDISNEEKAELIKPWNKARSTQAHGTIIQGTNEEKILLYEMDDLVYVLLSSELKPRIVSYLVFEKDSLQENVYKHYGQILDQNDNKLCVLPLRLDSYKIWKRQLKYYVSNNKASILLVSHNKVEKLKDEVWTDCDQSDLKPHTELIKRLQNKINL